MIKAVTGGLYTDADANADDMDADDTDNDDNDNDTRRTEHDCIGSLPNEPKIPKCHWLVRSNFETSSDVTEWIAC